MTVVAAAEYRVSEIEGDSLDLDALPEDISAGFQHPSKSSGRRPGT
jgi:hypothetical protein